MLTSTTRFAVVEIVHNSDGFAIAKGHWDGDRAQLRLACRWHELDGIGFPSVADAPEWLLLPPRLSVDYLDALDPRGHTLRITFL